ncbi:MAG: transposase family protein, partial [Deltaproteobacteria bacterium]|nr:transposase family protein [Deltaproteobacteria bacterium]
LMTGTKLAETIFSHFSVIEDPRAPNSVHSFDNILFCAVVGVLCGADDRRAYYKRALGVLQ